MALINIMSADGADFIFLSRATAGIGHLDFYNAVFISFQVKIYLSRPYHFPNENETAF